MKNVESKSPTWWEGYEACSVGWPLYDGHSLAYQAGWFYRYYLVNSSKD